MYLLRLAIIDSTNTYAKMHLKDLENETVIVAETQTAGRGRHRHFWRSDIKGNIYASIILKPEMAVPEDLPTLTQVLAQAVIDVLKSYGVVAEMKWPNDVMVAGKKIAGILAEAISQGMRVKGLVLGLGVNVAMPQDVVDAIDQPATSLNLILGRVVDREELLGMILNRFFDSYPC
jgi:BirA family biotin operon repressor/biotin-[acetyl-CoA-carboxylase] ligase